MQGVRCQVCTGGWCVHCLELMSIVMLQGSIQGYLFHMKQLPFLEPPKDPRYSETAGSKEGGVSRERGAPVHIPLEVRKVCILNAGCRICNSPHKTAGAPILHVGFKTATLQNTICTRIRRSNLVTEQLSPSNGSKARQNVYKSFLKCGVLQSGVGRCERAQGSLSA